MMQDQDQNHHTNTRPHRPKHRNKKSLKHARQPYEWINLPFSLDAAIIWRISVSYSIRPLEVPISSLWIVTMSCNNACWRKQKQITILSLRIIGWVGAFTGPETSPES